MSEYCTNCATLADLNINQAKTIAELQAEVVELQAKLAACGKAIPIIRKVAKAKMIETGGL